MSNTKSKGSKSNVNKLVLTAMFCAMAYSTVAISRLLPPIVLFLKYDPKDIVITLAGLILGPVSALITAVISSLIEMLTVSDTGVIGLVMNILSSASFACTASIIYKKRRTLAGAGIGLVSGCVVMVIMMLLWNYCITPLYMGYPRDAVADMLLPVFLPFNLIKGGLNAAFTFLLYKPLIGTLRKAKLIPQIQQKKTKANMPMIIAAIIIIVTCVLVILSMKEVI